MVIRNSEIKYRELQLDEIAQEGDQRFNPVSKKWENIIILGRTCNWINPFLEYRRPLNKEI